MLPGAFGAEEPGAVRGSPTDGQYICVSGFGPYRSHDGPYGLIVNGYHDGFYTRVDTRRLFTAGVPPTDVPPEERVRIVSLAPSATATLAAAGVGSRVVGATTHCDFDVPAVGGWLTPDFDRIDALEPDLVCTSDPLQREIRDALADRGFDVCHVEPTTLPAVFDSFETLGAAVGAADAGRRLARSCRERVATVSAHPPESRPVVYCEEWSDPPMAAGNWVPEAVTAAGGVYPFVEPGERSRPVDPEAVADADPDHVVLHICGRGDRVDPAVVADRGWDLDARVHVVDDSLLNQPGPRLVGGIERLHRLLRC